MIHTEVRLIQRLEGLFQFSQLNELIEYKPEFNKTVTIGYQLTLMFGIYPVVYFFYPEHRNIAICEYWKSVNFHKYDYLNW